MFEYLGMSVSNLYNYIKLARKSIIRYTDNGTIIDVANRNEAFAGYWTDLVDVQKPNKLPSSIDHYDFCLYLKKAIANDHDKTVELLNYPISVVLRNTNALLSVYVELSKTCDSDSAELYTITNLTPTLFDYETLLSLLEWTARIHQLVE